MRSDLLRKFPRPLIYAQPAHRDKTTRVRSLDDSAAPIFPAFQATIDPDVTMFGFNLSGDPFTNGDDEGYYFVIKERAGQLRFGLDEHVPDDGVGRLGRPVVGTPAGCDRPPDASRRRRPRCRLWTRPSPANRCGPIQRGHGVDPHRSQVMYARHAVDMLPRS
jgi:hypothetical protein